ncbi:MAG: hypothetical protein AAF558_13000 [Verrucomicrobiota bacterium]
MNDGVLRLLFALFNCLGIAGVGTYMSGRKTVGIIQMIISLGAFALTLIPMVQLYRQSNINDWPFFKWYIGLMLGDIDWTLPMFYCVLLSFAGLVFFFMNLLWSFTTTKPIQPPPPPIPN